MRRKKIVRKEKKTIRKDAHHKTLLYFIFGIFAISLFLILTLHYRKQDTADAAKTSFNTYLCTSRKNSKKQFICPPFYRKISSSSCINWIRTEMRKTNMSKHSCIQYTDADPLKFACCVKSNKKILTPTPSIKVSTVKKNQPKPIIKPNINIKDLIFFGCV